MQVGTVGKATWRLQDKIPRARSWRNGDHTQGTQASLLISQSVHPHMFSSWISSFHQRHKYQPFHKIPSKHCQLTCSVWHCSIVCLLLYFRCIFWSYISDEHDSIRGNRCIKWNSECVSPLSFLTSQVKALLPQIGLHCLYAQSQLFRQASSLLAPLLMMYFRHWDKMVHWNWFLGHRQEDARDKGGTNRELRNGKRKYKETPVCRIRQQGSV